MSRAVAVATLVILLSARADASPLPIEYQAPPECVSPADFAADLRALPSAKGPTAAPRAIVVRIAHDGPRFVGSLHVEGADGAVVERRIEGASCDEVSYALEVVAALAAGLEAPRPAARPLPAVVRPPPAAPAAVAAPPPRRFGAAVFAHAAAIAGLSPSLEAAPELGVAVEWRGPQLVSPELRLSALWARSPTLVQSGSTAVLTLTTAMLDLCPLRLELGSVALLPCAGAQAGAYHGSGSGEDLTATPTTKLWLAAVVTGRVEWALVRWLTLELDAGATAPLVGERSYFGNASAVYTTPHVGALGSLGIAVRLL